MSRRRSAVAAEEAKPTDARRAGERLLPYLAPHKGRLMLIGLFLILGTLAELFTDRPVVGIHAVDLVLGFGSLHCLTQQQPR